MISFIKKILVSSCCCAFVTACVSHKIPDHVVQTPHTDLHVKPDQVVIVQPASRISGTCDDLSVSSLKSITVHGHLMIEMAVVNHSGLRDVLYYRMRWLDQTGVMLGQYTSWQTESVDGLGQTMVIIPSPYENATDFRIEIKSKNDE